MCISETDAQVGTGTGFIYEHLGSHFLITNGHNFTGVNADTQKRISTIHAGFPDTVRVQFRRKIEDSFYVPIEFDNLILYEDDEKFCPRWYVHPKHGYKVDVIALPISFPDYVCCFPINSELFDASTLRVSDEVFILGYRSICLVGVKRPFGKEEVLLLNQILI